MPIEEEPEFEEPAEEEQPPPEQDLNISALPMASAAETLPGILEGLSALSMESQGPGVGSGAGAGEGAGIGPGEGAGLGPGEGGGAGGGVYRPGSGVESPRVIREVTPKYTAEAMRAKVQGVVWLDAVVLPDGTVGDVQVTRSLDPVFGSTPRPSRPRGSGASFQVPASASRWRSSSPSSSRLRCGRVETDKGKGVGRSLCLLRSKASRPLFTRVTCPGRASRP